MNMTSMLLAGALLAILSGLMNGSFTLPMRFLGRWEWENVWSLFIVISCLLMPAAIVSVIAPQSWVILGQDLDAGKISARNVLRGTVSGVHEGAVNNEVAVTLSGGSTLTAIITKESSHALGLKEGGGIFAAFKANNVILAVD